MTKLKLQQRLDTYSDSLYLSEELHNIARDIRDGNMLDMTDRFLTMEAAESLSNLYRLTRTLTAYVLRNERNKTKRQGDL